MPVGHIATPHKKSSRAQELESFRIHLFVTNLRPHRKCSFGLTQLEQRTISRVMQNASGVQATCDQMQEDLDQMDTADPLKERNMPGFGMVSPAEQF